MDLKSKKYPEDIIVENNKGTRCCNKCRKQYILTREDISTKNPNVYYKICKPCRDYSSNMVKKFYERTGKTYKSYM